MTYLANLLTAGDEKPVRLALRRLCAVRRHMRSLRVDKKIDKTSLDEVGLTAEAADNIYRLLALARLEDRFVIPTAGAQGFQRTAVQGRCGYTDIA
jgi:nitrate reductase beta subunit